MNGSKTPKLTNSLLLILICLLVIDIAIGIWPSLSLNPFNEAGNAYAEDKKDAGKAKGEPSGSTLHFPPFPLEENRVRLFHVGLWVKDLDKSIDFYCNKLGYKLLRTQDMGFVKMGFISTGDGEPIIELEQLIYEVKGYSGEGFSHIGMFADDPVKFYEDTKKNGVKWEGKPSPPGPGAPIIGFIIDPDGHRIEVLDNPKGKQAFCQSCHRGPHLN